MTDGVKPDLIVGHGASRALTDTELLDALADRALLATSRRMPEWEQEIRADERKKCEAEHDAYKREQDAVLFSAQQALLTEGQARNNAERKLAGECETCEGSGVMQVVVGVKAPYGEEIFEPEECAECEGTGKSWIADLIQRGGERAGDIAASLDRPRP